MQETIQIHELTEPLGQQLPLIWQNLTYYGHHQLTLCVPPNLTGQTNPHYPVILFAPDKNLNRLSALLQLTAKGYAVALLDFLDDQPTDLLNFNSAARFLMLHAWQYQLDSNRLIAMGEGAGAYVAAAAVLATGQQKINREDVHTLPVNFHGCLTLGGQFDLTARSQLAELVGKRRIAPFLLLHGTADTIAPLQASHSLLKFLGHYNIQAELYQIKDCPHDSDAFFTPYMIDILAAFIKQVTQKGK